MYAWGICVYNNKTISLFTILGLMEFEIADLLHFEVGKLCSNITQLQNITENRLGHSIYSVIFVYFWIATFKNNQKAQ